MKEMCGLRKEVRRVVIRLVLDRNDRGPTAECISAICKAVSWRSGHVVSDILEP